ncbi:MAG: helix-turn-helix domain-containing protein [Nitrososphaeria archaeon]|nr:helix-turn-helix domain-containing protein [Nitrososphaeria archaeon]
MTQLLLLTLIFTALFAIQTTVFTYLLLKLRKSMRSIERPRITVEHRYETEEVSESELRILRELSSSGPLGAREISRRLGLSREHTARTLKKMVEDGLLIREGKPYRYKITDLGSELLRSRDVTG